MQIPVLIEPVAGNGYRAQCGGPLPVSVEAETPDKALTKLREQLSHQLPNGAQLVSLDVVEKNPWMTMAGILDPKASIVRKWKRAMAKYRQEVEDDPDYV